MNDLIGYIFAYFIVEILSAGVGMVIVPHATVDRQKSVGCAALVGLIVLAFAVIMLLVTLQGS